MVLSFGPDRQTDLLEEDVQQNRYGEHAIVPLYCYADRAVLQ